jgi:hypothetical protein
MKECLDEATLQSYFDGELSTSVMESATVHLASCAKCSAAARELEEETALLNSALAAEFESVVPTENLRRRINAAILDPGVPSHVAHENRTRTFFSSFAAIFSFVPQRALTYSALVVVLTFAGIIGLVKFRHVDVPSQVTEQTGSVTSAPAAIPIRVESATPSPVAPVPQSSEAIPKIAVYRPGKLRQPVANKPAPVKLLPGERSYLRAIARLDSAIKSEKRAMQPALQVEYERNLAVVDRAIAATRTAAKNNPDDPDTADFMFAAYQSKLDLLNTIADARLGGRSH